jgi:ribonucleoside-diphosphate reductase alpha chain
MVLTSWKRGDPGIVFIDEINRHNPTPECGLIEATNPCGEQPLLPYESCTLGSINLATMTSSGSINWDKLQETVGMGIHFLDNVIEVNKFILPEIEDVTTQNRKIGLGVMGFADMLSQLKIPYASERALKCADEVMHFISQQAIEKSHTLSKERGSFPNFRGSIWEKNGFSSMRNASLLTVAPTGTISILAGTSSGIEPHFALSFYREVMSGLRLLEVNPVFKRQLEQEGICSDALLKKISQVGSIQQLAELPQHLKPVFQTAFDISPEWHIRMQAAFQQHCDNAVSKTINLPSDATPDEIRKAYLLAQQLKCKGITVYRYGTKKSQVLNIGHLPAEDGSPGSMRVASEESGECRECSF